MSEKKKVCHIRENDFLVPLKEEELFNSHVLHIHTGLYEDPLDSAGLITDSAICGFSEWGQQDYPVISISWDWCFKINSHGFELDIQGAPFSNIKLMEPNGEPYSFEEASQTIRTYIDTLNWKPGVLSAIKRHFN